MTHIKRVDEIEKNQFVQKTNENINNNFMKNIMVYAVFRGSKIFYDYDNTTWENVSDDVFISEAERTGKVWTLEKFLELWNSDDDGDARKLPKKYDYIRFIPKLA